MNELTKQFLKVSYAKLELFETQIFSLFKLEGKISNKLYWEWKDKSTKLLEIHGGLI